MSSLAPLWNAIYPVCTLQNNERAMLVKGKKLEYGEKRAASLDFVLVSPPYHNRCARDEENLNHDIFPSVDMKSMLNLCNEIVQPGAVAYIVCSALQSGLRYSVISMEGEVQYDTVWCGSDPGQKYMKVDVSIWSGIDSISSHS